MNYSDMKMLEHLKLELSMRNKIESNEIMEAFSQYVDNKNDLSEMIELGMLRFEYFVTDKCIGCKLCYSKCPQKCIDISVKPVVIHQNNCLHCGNCYEICPTRAIEKRG